MLTRGKQAARGFIAQLAVVYPGRDTGIEHRPHERLVELVIVDQSAIANSAVENLDVRTVTDPIALGVYVLPVQHGCHSYHGRHTRGEDELPDDLGLQRPPKMSQANRAPITAAPAMMPSSMPRDSGERGCSTSGGMA